MRPNFSWKEAQQVNVVPGGFDYAGTGLHYAAFNGHRPMVGFLLDHGADRDVKDTKVKFDGGRMGGSRGSH